MPCPFVVCDLKLRAPAFTMTATFWIGKCKPLFTTSYTCIGSINFAEATDESSIRFVQVGIPLNFVVAGRVKLLRKELDYSNILLGF